MFGFLTIKDIIDILLMAITLYECYRILKRMGAVNLFWGILIFIISWYLAAYIFQLELMGELLTRVIDVGALALIVIFQDEIRTFFSRIGARFNGFKLHQSLFKTNDKKEMSATIKPLIEACKHLSKQQTGALIVLPRTENLDDYIATGERIDARISSRLIENIFFKNTPLHDGAMILNNGRIVAASCILPVSKATDIPAIYGLRHRAALGMAEKTDAAVIVVSEETGHIALAEHSTIRDLSIEELQAFLLANE